MFLFESMTIYNNIMFAMEANVNKYTYAVGSGKQAITQRQNGKEDEV